MSEIHYPAGVKPPKSTGEGLLKKQTKKPKSVSSQRKIAPGNRGMAFEAAINESNAHYREKGLCLITKRPTPIKVVHVDYAKGPKITDAFYETQSTTDYNGVYRGHYIDFEAKETQSATSFPLANIPLQQIEHLEAVLAQGGIAFFLIRFAKKGEVFLLPASFLCSFYREKPRASIPYSTFLEKGYPVKEGYHPRVDYLPVLIDAFAL